MRWVHAAAVALAAVPASAQTFEEAVRANVALAVQLCAGSYGSSEAWLGAFRTAGFAEQKEDLGNGEFNHHFHAPAETIVATVYLGHMAPECTVTTTHMGVSQTSTLLDGLIPKLYPEQYGRQEWRGATQPAAGAVGLCVRYEELNAELPQVLAVSPAKGAEGCIENGTSRILIATLV